MKKMNSLRSGNLPSVDLLLRALLIASSFRRFAHTLILFFGLLVSLTMGTAAHAAPVWQTGTGNQTTNSGSSNTASATLSINKPANVQAGDLVIVTLHYNRTSLTISNTQGFTQIRNETSGANGDALATVAAFYKIATASEPAIYSFTYSGSVVANITWRAVAQRVTGHDPTTPIGNQNGSNSSSTTTQTTRTVSSINTTLNDSLMVAAISMQASSSTITAPSGTATGASSTSTDPSFHLAYQTIATAGATGDKIWNWSTARANAALMFIINPAPLPADYSDAPATYGDASHTIVSGIYLGDNAPDAETASKYSYNARADNNDDGAPSQPVSTYIPLFPVLQMTDTSYSAGFKVTNTTGTAGKLYGWIDFDQSGTFESSEAAVVNVPTGSSKATVTLNWTNIPANIKLGTTIIRLRLTTDGSVTTSTPTGNASNGEVEDYPIAVAMDIPPNSPSISIIAGATPAACEAVVFQDNFNDLASGIFWGNNRAGSQAIRNWSRAGGGNDTYAQTVNTASGTAIYFGNGAVRQISPSIGTGFSFDANGKLLTTIDAISLRDNIDDTTPGTTAASGSSESDWGPNPVTLSRTFATTAGKAYRLYFKAIPEDIGGAFVSGIMRLDAPGGSIHFKAPGSSEGTQSYAVEFTALGSSSTISFINYGHVENDNSGWCDPNSVYNANAWCSPGGRTDAKHGNELIIDDVVLTEAGCPGGISGIVYTDSNSNNTLDASETKLPNITVKLYDSTKTNVLQTVSTNASGAYSFTAVSVGTYQIEVDTADTDLPAGASIGTTNPLASVAVTSGATITNQNFGFDTTTAACAPPAPTTTGINASITWNHNPYSPASQTVGGHHWPLILNTGLIAAADNELISNLTTGPTDWELYTEAASVPATLAQAISGNKYFQYSFTTKPTLANDNILYGVAMSTLGPLNIWNHSGKYKMQIQIDDNAAFSSPTVLKNLIQIDENNPTTGGDVSEGPLYGSDFYISHYDLDTPVTLAANKTYYVRFYLYDVTTAGVANSIANRIIFDDLLLKTYDCGSPPATLLSVNDTVVTEGNSGLTYLNFPVQLSAAAPPGGISFDYATADDTATLANNDYQAKSGTLTIPMGANGSVISVPVVGDTNIEPNERVKLNITNLTNATLMTDTAAKGTIIDDDAAVACDASAGQFGGIVFQDYNQNGSRESGEIGLAGVTVTAYNSSNASAATATTNADGWYVLNGLTSGTQYRLEFTNLPAGAESGATGKNTTSSVQFVTASATCAANMGVYNPVDYCQADPKLLTARYVNGDTSATGADLAGTFGALMSFNYSASGINPTLNTDALGSQVGGIWGLAYNRTTKKAFASAMIRRHMGLGPLGIGGIYVVDYSTATPTASNFLNVDGLAGIDVGSIDTNSVRGLLGDPYQPNHDPTVFDKVGKEGLGDMELSDDGNTLYVTNLYSRKIIKIDLSTYNTSGTIPTTASQISLPGVACTNGVARPFGLKYYRGKLYTGITCTGENGGTSADLKASIQAYDGTSWVEKLQVPLNYQTWHADHMRASEYSRSNIPWVSSMSQLTFGDHGIMDWADDSQLLLSGIEFDTNGDLLLGFIDRTGLQFGQNNYGTDTASTRFYGVFSNGELLKASYNALTGAYTLENAGIANGVAGVGAKTGTDPAWPYGGPGGGEFYGDEKFSGHTENSFGALAVVPGKQELALNAMNPFNLTSGGTLWLNNNTGTRTRGAQLYGSDNRYFGKAVGLGDIEVLCDPAPTEIGNRVWLDTDKDGIQDASESGINNVTVTLACGTDSATATTNAAGEYYFSNKTGGNATFMNAGESCKLKVNSSQASLSSYALTTQNADGKTDNNRFTDIRDSDAANNAGTAEINFTVGSAGQNNHGLDFGYQPASTSAITGKVFEDVNYGGGAGRAFGTAGTAGVNGARVELYNSSGAFVSSTTTAADGSYTFSNLGSGNYYVRIANGTVKSTRSGSNGMELGIQTYRTDGTTANTNEVGGRKPASADTAANTTSQNLNTTTFLLSASGQAQSVQPVTMAGGNISGVDFGFNFSTVVNTNDSGQGSLRQFINNANLLGNTGLVQTLPSTVAADYTTGDEVSIFMIPSSGLSGGVAVINVGSSLPSITAANTAIDGRTQTGNIGDTNNGNVAAATTVGVDNVALAAVAAPEIALVGQTSMTGLDVRADNTRIRGIGLRRFDSDIRFDQFSQGAMLNDLALGVNPVNGADPGAGERSNQHIAVDATTRLTLKNSLLGYNQTLRGIVIGQNNSFSDSIIFITGNHFVGAGQAGGTDNGAIEILRSDNATIPIIGNKFAGRGKGIATDLAVEFREAGAGITYPSYTVQNNDISGFHDGVGYFTAAASIKGPTISKNRISGNTEFGVILSGAKTTMTQNSIYNNGKLGINLMGGNEPQPTGGMTLNDANDADSGPNDLLNFPILQQVTIANGNAIVRGCAPAGAVVEFFEADVSPGGAATAGANRFGLSTDYGEGQTYLGSLVEGGAADTDNGNCNIPAHDGNDNTGMKAFQFSVPAPVSLAVGDYLTATATIAASGTSEFGPTVAAIADPPPIGSGSCAATGGSDILFIVDNSGSITPAEYADFSATIQKVGAQLLTDNPANKIAVAHFGGPTDSLVSGGQYVYIERDFSNTAMNAPVRQFGTNGAYNVNWWADHLAGAVQQMRYALDGNASTTSSYIVSPVKEMSRNTAAPLQIVLMTDAVRYGDWTPNDISMLIDPAGSGAEPDDGSNFTIYNQLKAQGVSFSVVSFNPDPTDIAASAAIASAGGAYTGNVEVNPKDPEGSLVTPRRFISVTSGFQLTTAQIDELVEGTAICSSTISGTVFEDVNYGGGNGRAFGTAGTVGVAGATIEVYDHTGAYVASTTTGADGIYKLPNLPDADYYVRVVSDTVNSSRAGSNGSEVPVPTWRSNGTTAVANEIGGRKPSAPDAGTNSGFSTLNTSTFVFSGDTLAGKPAQAVQLISLSGSSVKNADFGFNFDTVVNTNDAGQGSLRQFLANANLLGDDASLAQTGRTAGMENVLLMLPANDPHYANNVWQITLASSLPDINQPLILDGSKQAGFTNSNPTEIPVIELNGNNIAGNGLTLVTGSSGSMIHSLTITQFGGDGINIQGDTTGNAILGNSIHSNGGLAIDLVGGSEDGAGVTANDNSANDADTGPNNLLNYPEFNTLGITDGSKIITYDFNLSVETAGTYHLEFFKNASKDPSGHGEGQVYLGGRDITVSTTGTKNYKGSFNANQVLAANDLVAATLTRKNGADYAETSEFSGTLNGATTAVCSEWVSGSATTPETLVIDENKSVVAVIKATDNVGNPITYSLKGADGKYFVIVPPSATTPACNTIKFVDPSIVITKAADANGEVRAIIPPGYLPPPGNFEIPMDTGKDNVYDFQISATYADGQTYVRDVSVGIMDVNEAPYITSAADVSFAEDTTGSVLDIAAQDPDTGTTEGNGLTYNITGGADAAYFHVSPASGILSFRVIPDYDAPVDADRNNVYEVEVTVADNGGLTATKLFKVTISNNTADDGVLLQARALLQGAYDSKTALMSSDLNTLGLLPTKQPYGGAPFNYAGTESLSAFSKETTGNDAVVDWLLVELRSSPTSVIASRAVVAQRDGDLVDAQTGSTDLTFAKVPAGNYYVSIRHRNHLGMMTASPVSLSNTAKMVDFSLTTTAVAGNQSRLVSGSRALMWAGDINASNTLTASGPGNDVTSLLGGVVTSTDNPQANTNYILRGYLTTDLNMDGKTLFSGPANDVSMLIGNIIMHPLNTGFAANYIMRGGLAQ
jgi:parallel beta-helix repeat protein